MRHDRPEPGRPTAVPAVNAALLRRQLAGTAPIQARRTLTLDAVSPEEVRAVVIADMVGLLDEGRIARGYADIFDLHRAGYHPDLAATHGPAAAKLLDRRIRDGLGDDAVADPLTDPAPAGDLEAA